jgi:hypothetical protein
VRLAIALLVLTALSFGAPCAFALPIVGASANTIPAGTFMLDVWGTYQNFVYSWDESSDPNYSGWVGFTNGNQIVATSFVPRIYYGVTDWLTIRAALPIEDRYADLESWSSAKSNTGLGDIIIDPKIQLYRGEGGFPRFSALAGVRFPTGDTEGVDRFRTLALSDGSTDYMIGGVITHVYESLTGHVCATYWLNGDTKSGTDAKDVWALLLSLESKVDEQWTLLWEFKGVYGRDAADFNRNYVCPGIMWNGEHTSIGLSAIASMTAHGGGGVSYLDIDWAPYFRAYYRFF